MSTSTDREEERLLRALEDDLRADTTRLYRAFVEASKDCLKERMAGQQISRPPALADAPDVRPMEPTAQLPGTTPAAPRRPPRDALVHHSAKSAASRGRLAWSEFSWDSPMPLEEPPKARLQPDFGGPVAHFVSPEPRAHWVVVAEECVQMLVEQNGSRLWLRPQGRGARFRGYVRLEAEDGCLARSAEFRLGSPEQ